MSKYISMIIFISIVVDLLAFTVILPLFPSILENYEKSENDCLFRFLKYHINNFREFVGAPDTVRWNAVLFGGIIGSLFCFLQFLSSPIIGALSDIYGRKKLMLITSIGMLVSYAVWYCSSNFTLFVISRIIGGFSRGNVTVATSIIGDITTNDKRTKGMALIGIAFAVGFLVGPLIGAYFSSNNKINSEYSNSNLFFQIPAIYAMTLSILNIFIILFLLPETLLALKKKASLQFSDIVPLIHPIHLFRFSALHNNNSKENRMLMRLGIVYFLYLFIYSGLEFTLTFLTHNRFNFDRMQQGRMFFVMGMAMICVQGGYLRRIKAGKEKQTAILGIVILIPSFAIIGFAFHQIALYIGLILFSFASATVVPCLTAEISRLGGGEEKGKVMGIFRSLGALARVFGPLSASIVYWYFGARYCFVFGSLFLLLPLFLLSRISHQHKVQ